ncbi:hypothetical protein LP7551_03099 [Roseibium album]|nr:hypothetical protein LP7551_03099 [Roseibium album]
MRPRVHLVLAGWFFGLAGASTATLVLFEFLCYALTSLLFVSICLKLKLRLAALFTPPIFAPMYVVAGFRLELSGALIFMSGLAISLPVLIKAVKGEKNQSGFEIGCSILGMALLGVAPLAAPATFAWSLGAIVVLQSWRLAARQAGLIRILFEGIIALALALVVFAVSIDFEFAEFLDQFTYHASRSTGGGFNDEAIFRAVIFAAAGAILFRKDRLSAAICAMLACGQFLAAFLHDKALIRNLAASMVFLIALDAVLAARWNKAKIALYIVLFLVLSANFFSFYLFSKDTENGNQIVAAYMRDIDDGKRVFVDETMAHHYLDQQTNGALSWTWGGTFPKGRATSLNDLEDGAVWYVSEYTLLGYLKGRHDVARKIWEDQSYVRVPQIPCVLGRHSCNLPVDRWTMMRLERDGETLSVQAIGEDTEPRILPAPMIN